MKISPRDFIFRVRELEQMEIEVFTHPDNWREVFDEWLGLQKDFFCESWPARGKIASG